MIDRDFAVHEYPILVRHLGDLRALTSQVSERFGLDR